MSCQDEETCECDGTGRVFTEIALEGRKVWRFVDCACRGPAPEERRSPRWEGVRFNAKTFDQAVGYQPHLAAFPGDPAAVTDGAESKQRLIDRRKREGWVPAGHHDSSARRPKKKAAGPSLRERAIKETMERKQRGELLDPRSQDEGT